MVLQELGSKLTAALRKLQTTTVSWAALIHAWIHGTSYLVVA
jgi:hypothetical protein